MTKKWQKHKEEILKLYLEQNKPLHEVRQIMQKTFGFEASVRAYRSRFDRWDITKYKCQRRRNSTNTVASTISSAPGDEFFGNPAFGPTSAHPPMLARLYSSPELGQVHSGDFVLMEHSHLTLALNARPPQGVYMPIDTEIQSPVESVSSASPSSGFHPLGFPYNSVPGHSYDHVNATGCNMHSPMNMATPAEHAPHLLSWRSDASGLDYHGSTRLHDALKSPYWWLNNSTVTAVLEELSYADVNQQNSHGETPLFTIISRLQASIHPVQVNVLLHLLQSPNASLTCRFQEDYHPLGILTERTLDSMGIVRQDEGMATSLCKCLCQLLNLGADPDILVRDKPIVHHFLQDPDHLMSYTTFWPFLEALCKRTAPGLYDSAGGNTALHCAVATGLQSGTKTSNSTVIGRARSAICLLLARSREYGTLNNHNGQGRSALQLLIERWTATDDVELWRLLRDLVRAGASTRCLVPEDFAERLHKLVRPRGVAAASSPKVEDLQQLADGIVPLPVVVWLSACESQSRSKEKETETEHLAALEACAGPLATRISVLESLLRSP